MAYNYAELQSMAVTAGRGDLDSLQRILQSLIDSNASLSNPYPITQNMTVNTQDVSSLNGRTLVWSGAFTVTLAKGLPPGFGFAAVPPAAGNASIASGNAAVTLNGATTTVTRALAANTVFAVVQSAADTYSVTGA